MDKEVHFHLSSPGDNVGEGVVVNRTGCVSKIKCDTAEDTTDSLTESVEALNLEEVMMAGHLFPRHVSS